MMKFMRLFAIILFLSQGFSPSWGTGILLLEDESHPPLTLQAFQPASQQDLFAMLLDDSLGELLSRLHANVIFRTMLTNKTHATKIKEKSTDLKVGLPLFLPRTLLQSVFSFRNLKKLSIDNFHMIDDCEIIDFSNGLRNLTNLTDLDLTGNRFKDGRLPNIVTSLTKLVRLGLSYCGLTDLPNDLCHLTALMKLDLSCSKFKDGGLPNVVASLTQLVKLDLVVCTLTDLQNDLCNLTALTDLNLMGTRFKDRRLPKIVTSLTKLVRLNIRACDLTDLPNDLLNLTNLTDLDLSSNEFNDRCLPNIVTSCTKLQRLLIASCRLISLPNELTRLPYLEYIDISDNLLTPYSVPTFKPSVKIIFPPPY